MARKYLRVPELVVGFDTETTGLDVTCERAISYGFCAYRYGQLEWSEQFFVLPDRPIAPAAQRVHGLSLEAIEEKRSSHHVYSVEGGLVRATEIMRDYQHQGAYFVGANVVRFDIEMLRRSYESVLAKSLNDDLLDVSMLQVIDVIEHDWAIEPSRDQRPRRGLEQLCHYYGIEPGGHDALGDARATVEVFFEQVVRNNRGQATLDLAPVPSSTNGAFEPR
ncbi:MAG: 3'-5' exonuclease [Acidobacteria bacterium]|nr:3'-5' exonuclease [Acidobacteriota bacterium]